MAALPRRVEIALCVLGVLLVAWAARLPHANPYGGVANPLPAHLDEYVHWGYAKAVAQQGRLNVTDPFTGAAAQPLSGAQLNERGFHAWFAAFQVISGLDWAELVSWAPVGVAVALALSAWLLAGRWYAAPAVLVFLAAVPSTLRFLGPGYFVPIAFAMPLLVLGLHLVVRWDEGGAPWPVVVLVAALWPIHAMAAGLLAATALVVAALRALRDPRGSAWLAVALVLVALVALPTYAQHASRGSDPGTLPASIDEVRRFGLATLLLAAAGAAALAGSREAPTRRLGIAMAAAALSFETIVLLRNARSVDVAGLYDRSILPLFTLGAILAGVAVARAMAWIAGREPLRARPTLAALVAALVLLLPLAASQESWIEQSKRDAYVVATPAQLDVWRELATRADVPHARAVVDGIGGLAFADVTGIALHGASGPSDPGLPPDIDAFLRSGANDTYFLYARGVTMLVTDRPVANAELVVVAPGVYELPPDQLANLGARPTAPQEKA